METKKYILLQNRFSVAYTEDDVYVNEEIIKKEDEKSRSAKEIAESLKDKFYDTFLKKHYKHIIVLTAAGTSLDNGSKSGKTRDGLWNDCRAEIKNIYREILPCSEKLKNIAKNKDIEDFLSHIILLEKTNDVKKEKLKPLRKKLECKIKELCTLELDDSAPHKDFLNRITARKRVRL